MWPGIAGSADGQSRVSSSGSVTGFQRRALDRTIELDGRPNVPASIPTEGHRRGEDPQIEHESPVTRSMPRLRPVAHAVAHDARAVALHPHEGMIPSRAAPDRRGRGSR